MLSDSGFPWVAQTRLSGGPNGHDTSELIRIFVGGTSAARKWDTPTSIAGTSHNGDDWSGVSSSRHL